MTRRKLFISILVAGSLFSASWGEGVLAAGGAPRVRTAVEEYSGSQAFLIGNSSTPNVFAGDCDPASDSGCVRFPLKKRDRFFTLEISDETGLPIYAVVFGPDGSELADLCGNTEEPLPSPGAFVDVWVTGGTCYESLDPSIPTAGVVEASFSKSRRALNDSR